MRTALRPAGGQSPLPRPMRACILHGAPGADSARARAPQAAADHAACPCCIHCALACRPRRGDAPPCGPKVRACRAARGCGPPALMRSHGWMHLGLGAGVPRCPGPPCRPNKGHILREGAQGFVSIAVGVKKGAPRGTRDGAGSKAGLPGAAQSQAAEGDGYGMPHAVRSLLDDREAYMMEEGIRERQDAIQDAIQDELVTNVRTSAHEGDGYDVVEYAGTNPLGAVRRTGHLAGVD